MPPTFLSRHFDAAIEPPVGLDRAELERRQVERIARSLAIVLLAGTLPRRLGGDASDKELALDKKRARRAGHALKQALAAWGEVSAFAHQTLDDEIRGEGARLLWSRWVEEHSNGIKNELRLVATWSIRNGEESWGKSSVVKLENELNWITYALRD